MSTPARIVIPEVDDQARFEMYLDDPQPEHEEVLRQARIAAGTEHACAVCGCSDSRACDEGCVWATESLCSRCV